MNRFHQFVKPIQLALIIAAFAVGIGYASGFLQAGGQDPTSPMPFSDLKKSNESDSPKSGISPQVQSAETESDTQAPPKKIGEAQRLVQNSIELLRKHSIQSTLRQRGMLFDTELITHGTYIQAEGGKGGTRIELSIETQNLKLEAKMVNDGAYFFRQVVSRDATSATPDSDSNKQTALPTVERINLRQIRNRFADDESWPGHWIAYGGLYLFMDQARRSFHFGPPAKKEIKGKPCSVIRGTWKPDRLAMLLPDQKESILAKQALNWKRIPQHIPLEIEIYFLTQGNLANFPFRIVFYRPTEELLEGIKKNPVLITEYTDPQIIDIPAKSTFQFNADENEVVDITEDFIASMSQ